MDFPQIVIEVQSGRVVAVYYEGVETEYVTFDQDLFEREEEPVHFSETMTLSTIPDTVQKEVRHAALAYLMEHNVQVWVTNEASDNYGTVGTIFAVEDAVAHLRDLEGGEVGVFELEELEEYNIPQ